MENSDRLYLIFFLVFVYFFCESDCLSVPIGYGVNPNQFHKKSFNPPKSKDYVPSVDTSNCFQIPSIVEVRDAGELKGKGLFAACDLQPDTFIGSYEGEYLTFAQYKMRYPKGDSEYVFLVNEESQRRNLVFIDAADPDKSNYTRYVNHSSANTNIKIISFSKSQRQSSATKRKKFSRLNPCKTLGIAMVTSTFVMKDEELLFDYGDLYDAPWK